MQLPVDVKALIDEMTDVQNARETSLSVSVYIEDSAAPELAAHVRNAFASPGKHVRMTVSYLDASFIPHPTDDVAVIVAGVAESVGASAAALREVGVPVMVATLEPAELARVAAAAGNAIPEGDIVSPYAGAGKDGASKDADAAQGEWDDACATALNERMGRWVVSTCRSKRLAFAIAFPFMRRPVAKDVVQLTAIENAGVGLIPILHGADLPIMTLNQAKMALQIAAAYGHDMDKNRLKELGFVIGGAYLSRGLVRRLAAAVPVLGFVFKSGVAFGTTTAVGYAIIEYFEGGEDITGVANVIERATELSADVATVAQKGLALAQAKTSALRPA